MPHTYFSLPTAPSARFPDHIAFRDLGRSEYLIQCGVLHQPESSDFCIAVLNSGATCFLLLLTSFWSHSFRLEERLSQTSQIGRETTYQGPSLAGCIDPGCSESDGTRWSSNINSAAAFLAKALMAVRPAESA